MLEIVVIVNDTHPLDPPATRFPIAQNMLEIVVTVKMSSNYKWICATLPCLAWLEFIYLLFVFGGSAYTVWHACGSQGTTYMC